MPAKYAPQVRSLTHGLVRGLLFYTLWLVLMPSLVWYDLLFGLAVTIAATVASLHLMPPELGGVRLIPLLITLPRFVWQSAQAGWDIAKRVFHPNISLTPGFVSYHTALRPGLARNTYTTLTSLLPGALSCEQTTTDIVYHVLDTQQPNLAALREEEDRLSGVLLQDPPSRQNAP